MKINIQAPSFGANEKLTNFVLDKVSKLEQFTNRIIQAEVLLKLDKSDTRDNKFCEIRLSIPGDDLFASKQHATFEEAILKTIEALRQQLVTWKEKSQEHKPRLVDSSD